MDTDQKERRAKEFDCTGSDEHYDFLCFPCSTEHKNVSASKYCKVCGNYLCHTCHIQHNRFEAMKIHEIVEINDEADVVPVDEEIPILPTLKCNVHYGKLLEMYCKEHDDVCCIICMTLKHSSCKDMTYIPKVAKDIDAAATKTYVQTRLRKQISNLVFLKEEKNFIKDKLMTQIKTGKTIIEDEKNMVVEYVKNLEMQLLEEINEMTGSIVRSANTHCKEIDHAIQTLEEREKLLTLRRNNLSDLFIQSIQIQNQLSDAEDLHSCAKMEPTNANNLYFRPNKNLSKQLKGIDSLGKFVNENFDDCLVSANTNVNVTSNASNKEQFWCDISGVCILTDGHLLLVDCKNRSLKKFNRTYELTSVLQMSAIPWSICTVNSTTAAVSLWNEQKVQLIWVQDEMKLCSSFKVSDRCSGIFHKDEKLYICVGGMKETQQGLVEVYTLSGIKLNTISCSLKRPRSVVVLDTTVFVADEVNGLVEIENNDIAVVHTSNDLREAQSLCMGPGGVIFVCGMASNNVFTFSVDDKALKPLLSEKDDIRKPQLVCFQQDDSRLLIGVENCNFLKVYNVHTDCK